MKRAWLFVGMLLALLAAWWAAPARAQSPVGLKDISPSEGRPGEKLEVRVYGYGFAEANEVRLFIEGVDVLNLQVLSDGEIVAVIRIPEGAPPGPRTVEVVADFGPDEVFSDTLPGGFHVMVAAPQEVVPPEQSLPQEELSPQGGVEEPYSGETDWPILLLLLLGAGIVLLSGAALAITLTVKWGRSLSHKKWEAQATDQGLPKTCQEGTYFVRREKVKIEPGRWKVTGVKVTLYDAAAGTRGEAHAVPEEMAKGLDKAARQRLLHGDSEDLRAEVDSIARELTALILAWQSLSQGGKDLFLETRLEGGKAQVTFVRYRCAGAPGRWQKQDEWTVKLKAIDQLPRAVRGPNPGEGREAYVAFLEDQARAYIAGVVEDVGTLF